ncbi:unnamed protein product [Mortierella alpina]
MASAVSAIFIFNLKGKVLISRNYRGDIPMSAVEKFLPLVLEAEEDSQAPAPCFTNDGINYLYIRHNNLFLLAITRKNSNATTVMLFLHTIAEVLTEYFKELEEESIRDNFVIIYELLDEMMDFGYPQTTESKILQEYITQDAYKLEVQVRPPMAVTNAVSWRSEGIRYRKNEVFLDVVESVNLLVNANGNVLRSEILGAVKMKVFLSGMPELRLGLNDKVMFESTGRSPTKGKSIEMEDVKFHQCVRLSKFENDRTISFIPRWRVRSHDISTQHSSQAIDLGGGSCGELYRKQSRVSHSRQSPVQASLISKQCRDSYSCSRGCRHTKIQERDWICTVRSREGLCHLEDQAVPGRQGVFDEGPLWSSLCQKLGGC